MEISEGRESCCTPVEEPPPVIMSNAEPEGVDQPKRTIMMRPGDGTSGREISLLANHLKVSIKCPDEIFYHYSVSITSDEKRAVNSKVIRRKIIDRLHKTYSSEFAGKKFAYDGEKNLYTVGPLPCNRLEFTVVVEESSARHASESPSDNGSLNHSCKRSKHSLHSKAFLVEIDYAAKIPLRSVDLALQGADPENVQDALRVLDIILRQQAANRGCLLVRQSFFHDDSRNFTDVGGGVMSCRGFHSSFRPTDGGLTLNMDVSTTMILSPGPVIDFLLANQNVKEPRYIDWARAKRMLKNLRVKAKHNNREFKIIGLTDRPCNQQLFSMKVKNGGSPDDGGETLEITVYEYFTKHRNIELSSSVYMPCLDVGKPKRPNYLPLELCYLVSLQRYTKALSSVQRASLVEKSRQKPCERIKVITDAVRDYSYDDDPFLVACGISIEKQLIQINGRVLDAPKLKVGKGEEVTPCNGRVSTANIMRRDNHLWLSSIILLLPGDQPFENLTMKERTNGGYEFVPIILDLRIIFLELKKHLFNPARIERWAVVNFSASCDTSHLSRELISCGRSKGIHFERPHTLIEEDPQYRRAGAVVRVEQMFEEIIARLPGHPDFLLCVLPERKNSELYGPWKKKSLTDLGIVTQCISPLKITDRYLTNVLLKINAKLGGTNSLLAMEHTSHLPLIKDTPTMILGMDVSHGSPGQSDIPSIAAVVGSLYWPLISKYRAVVRSQSPKLEIIESLYKPLPNGDDEGIMRELLLDFYRTSNGHKPAQIIVFRDGVSESQFSQVLNLELDQMIKAYKHLGEGGNPKFTLIVAQKNHHTKLFQANAVDNVPPGTVVDTNIVHPRNNDFFMCAHAGMIGTTKPAHYHVLLDEIGFAPDVLQNLIHSLSYVYQRSTSATSIVAPVRYAHLAAQQFGQFDKYEDHSETSSEQGSVKSIGTIPVTELPRLHKNVSDSMFFC